MKIGPVSLPIVKSRSAGSVPELPGDRFDASPPSSQSFNPWSVALAGAGVLASCTATQASAVTEIAPQATDPAIPQARGPHLAYLPQATPNGYLLLSLGGTNSLPSDFRAFDTVAAEQGFAALALDYPNTVITTSCKTSPEPDPCTLFRQEIATGDPVSQLVEVSPDNSIEHRLEALLAYQAKQDPEHFGQFYNESGPVWSKIVVVGHSQGSGHAAYLAKRHPLQAVIMLAGPQDTTAAGPASWVSAPGATPPERFLSLLHRDDFFGSESQLDIARILRQDPAASASASGPVVMSDQPVTDPHMSVISPIFTGVWQNLLKQAVE